MGNITRTGKDFLDMLGDETMSGQNAPQESIRRLHFHVIQQMFVIGQNRNLVACVPNPSKFDRLPAQEL
jgi:hypothetical protein